MAKRFTDSDKWKREWFSNLDTKAKLAWFYLLDQCDHTGIWPRNFKMMSQDLGFKVDHDLLMTWFATKVVLFDADKYFIPSFFGFQYGHRKNEFKARISAVEKLKSLGLLDENEEIKKTITQVSLKEELPNPTEELPNSYGIGISIGTSIFERESERKLLFVVNDEQFDALYAKYPRKEGKSAGKKTFKAQIKTPEDLLLLNKALGNYVAHVKRNVTEPKFIKQFSTFMNSWRDWLDPDAGQVEGIGYENEMARIAKEVAAEQARRGARQ